MPKRQFASPKDVIELGEELIKRFRELQAKGASGFKGNLIRTIPCPTPRGHILIVTLGNVKKGILPSAKDLENLRDLCSDASRDLGIYGVDSMFYPDILTLRPIRHSKGDMIVVLEIGSRRVNLYPDQRDLKSMASLIKQVLRGHGPGMRVTIKSAPGAPKDIRTEPIIFTVR